MSAPRGCNPSPGPVRVGAGLMRILLRRLADGFDVCPRLGLVLAPAVEMPQMPAMPSAQVLADNKMGRYARLRQEYERRQAERGYVIAGRTVRHVLAKSPASAADLRQYDVIQSVSGQRWGAAHLVALSDRETSELTLDVFMPRYFKSAKVIVRIAPEPFAPLDDVIAAAALYVAQHPSLPSAQFNNPRSPLSGGWVQR